MRFAAAAKSSISAQAAALAFMAARTIYTTPPCPAKGAMFILVQPAMPAQQHSRKKDDQRLPCFRTGTPPPSAFAVWLTDDRRSPSCRHGMEMRDRKNQPPSQGRAGITSASAWRSVRSFVHSPAKIDNNERTSPSLLLLLADFVGFD